MKTQLSTLIFFFVFLHCSFAQSLEDEIEDLTPTFEKIFNNPQPSSVLLKMNITRIVYGPNVGVDVKLTNRVWLSLLYNYHIWDFATVAPEDYDYLRGEYFPNLQRMPGHSGMVQLIFQKPENLFYQGFGVGHKRVEGTDLIENRGFAFLHPLSIFVDKLFEDRKQQNHYAYYTVGYRRMRKYVKIETYGKIGLTHVTIDSRQRLGDTHIELDRRQWLLPYLSIGVSVNFGL